MSEDPPASQDFDDEMSAYLQTFLDETEEQLDDLVETLLLLERDASDTENLNESFRLIHSIKGSAGMMGLEPISMLTHHLENRFERFRSGTEVLDALTMNLVLRCVDFLRQCAERLRGGESLGSPTELLEELKQLENETRENSVADQASSESAETQESAPRESSPPESVEPLQPSSTSATDLDNGIQIRIQFREGLALVDLKAQLIVTRLTKLGEIRSIQPSLEDIAESNGLKFEVTLSSDCDTDQIRAAADVDGVENIEVVSDEPVDAQASTSPRALSSGQQKETETVSDQEVESDASADETVPADPIADSLQTEETTEPQTPTPNLAESTSKPTEGGNTVDQPGDPSPEPDTVTPAAVNRESFRTPQRPAPVATGSPEKSTKSMSETMRVGIDRLDNLMNLAGELVVNRAQFIQIAEQLTPLQQRSQTLSGLREFGDALRQAIEVLESDEQICGDRRAVADQLREGLQVLDLNSQSWEHDRQYFEKFDEAVDQLSRVSQGLQRGVLDTRMVPVGPLFNRFKRVVRDLALERGKQVDLAISGEKTELDKRMIDELGDPLIHLVRNAIDHGLESTDDRLAQGKAAVGTIELEAAHSGNNVYIYIRDDGGGIAVEKIKARLVRNGVLTEAAAKELNDEQALEFIWHPGFSTADQITDVSGRGVGMDVVQDRVHQLNGGLSVDSTPGEGTQFTIRLPLTLAIINCLLVRLRNVVFSMPIDHVREIVSIPSSDVVQVRQKQTIDVRNEIIPLMSIEEIFDWNDPAVVDLTRTANNSECEPEFSDVVILQAAGKTLGLPVDELLGSQDMVIKSLSDNFVDISGLSGASILGDGSVCLMLDVGTIFRMISGPSLRSDAQGWEVESR